MLLQSYPYVKRYIAIAHILPMNKTTLSFNFGK